MVAPRPLCIYIYIYMFGRGEAPHQCPLSLSVALYFMEFKIMLTTVRHSDGS